MGRNAPGTVGEGVLAEGELMGGAGGAAGGV